MAYLVILLSGLLASNHLIVNSIEQKLFSEKLTIANAIKQQVGFTDSPLYKGNNFEGTGRPPNRSSGGGRGPCDNELIALVPGVGSLSLDEEECNSYSDAVKGFSIQPQPRFWLYVPGNYENGTELTIQLKEGDQTVAVKNYSLPSEAGIASISLDYTLETGKSYTWNAEIKIFTGRGRSQNPVAGGIIERQVIDQSVLEEMSLLPSIDRARRYASLGFWYDALNEFADLRISNPDDFDLLTEWRSLLEDFGLELMADQPFLDCCDNNETISNED